MKKVLKIACLLLALVMILSACGTSGNKSSAPAAPSSKADTPASSNVASQPETTDGYAFEAAKDTPQTLSIYIPWAGSLWETWGSDPVSKRITEQTGISFEAVAPVTDDDTKLSLLISSDDLPDLIVSDWNDKNWSAMLQQGMLADLEQTASEYAPKLFSECIDPELQDYVRQEDGTIRFLLGHWRTKADIQWYLDHDYLVATNQNVILMRQDYLEEIGNPEIKSPEDFMAACEKIKEKHPDTIPFYTGGVTKTGPGSLRVLFGVGSYYVAEDGTVSASYRNPEYLNMYKWINEMTRKGLMTEDSFVDGEEEKNAKSLSGEVTSYVWTVGETGKIPANNPDTTYYPMQPWDCYKQVRTNTGWLRSVISAKSEKKDTAVRWMEFGNTKIGAQTMCWGIEGDPDAEWSGDVVNGPHFFWEENGEKATLYPGFQETRNADWDGTERKSGIGCYQSFVCTHDVWMNQGEITGSDLMKEMNAWYGPKVEYDNGFVFDIPAGSDEAVANQTINSLIEEYNVKWAFASSAEEVETLYNEFLGRVESETDEALLNKLYTEQYNANKK